MPGGILYNPVADPVSRMDGQKTLRRLIEETEWDRGILVEDGTVKQWLHLFLYLAEAGYFLLEAAAPVTEQRLESFCLKLTYLRRRRAASPARASRLSVAVVGSGTSLVT